MNICEQRAHDLALLFVKYQLEISRQDTDAEYDEDYVYSMYKAAYDNFYENIIDP